VTKEEYDLLRSELAKELDKPKDQQDVQFMHAAVKKLQETGGQFDQPAGKGMSAGEQMVRMPRALAETLLSSIVGMGTQMRGTLEGIKGAIDPNDTYMDAKNRVHAEADAAFQQAAAMNDAGSPGGISPEGRAMMGGLQQGAENFGIPQALDATGDVIEAVAGPEARDATGTAALLATMRAPKSPAATTPGQLAVARMRQNGFIVPPGTPTGTGPGGKPLYAGTLTERTASRMASTATIEDAISMANQSVAQRYAARAGGLPEGQVTPGGVKRATDAANEAYGNLKKFDVQVLLPLPEYNGLLRRIHDIVDNTNPLRGRPNPDIVALRDRLLKANGARVPHFVDEVRALREDSFLNSQAARNGGGARLESLSKAQRQAADILDDALDSFLRDTAAQMSKQDPATGAIVGKLYEGYTQARSRLSTLHVIRDAMNEQTGAIDASVIHNAGQTTRLHPDLQKIAEAYEVNPKALRAPEQAARTASAPLSAVDTISLGFGVTGAGAGYAVGGATGAGLGAMAAIAPLATRMVARQYALRGPSLRSAQRAAAMAVRAGARGVALEESLPGMEPEYER
jgi:hypothetical protein